VLRQALLSLCQQSCKGSYAKITFRYLLLVMKIYSTRYVYYRFSVLAVNIGTQFKTLCTRRAAAKCCDDQSGTRSKSGSGKRLAPDWLPQHFVVAHRIHEILALFSIPKAAFKKRDINVIFPCFL